MSENTRQDLTDLSFITPADVVNRMSAREAKQVATLLETLLSDVICKQVLPSLVGPAVSALDLVVDFRLRLRSLQDDNRSPFDWDAAAEVAEIEYGVKSRRELQKGVGQFILASKVIGFSTSRLLRSEEHFRVFILLHLLAQIFINNPQPELNLVFLPMLEQRATDGRQIRLNIPFSLPSCHRLVDLLAELLTDGYDLTPLKGEVL